MLEDAWQGGEEAATVRQLPTGAIAPAGWEAIVVGAGPAGALAARLLALGGRRVLLLDRRRFPRDKTCGDALIPDAQACLRRHGLLERVRRIAWAGGGGDLWAPSRARVALDCPVLTVPRARLDAELARAAVEAGATFAQGTVDDVCDGGRSATVRLAGGAALAARLVLVATGAHVRLVGRAGLLTRERASAVAVRTYLRSRHRVERLLVSFDRAILPGYAWIFPVAAEADGSTTYNVGCGVVLDGAGEGAAGGEGRTLRPMLGRFLAEFPEGRALAAAEVGRGEVRGALLRCGLEGAAPWRGGAVLAAGEAIGATFPLTGEGIGKAMETGELAAEAMLAALTAPDAAAARAALARYASRLDRELRPKYRGYALAERWMARPWLADLVLRRAARRPRVRAAMTGILQETVDPARVFSLGGALRALIG